MKDKLIVDLDNTITIDSSSSDYQTKLLNQDVTLHQDQPSFQFPSTP